MFILLLLKHTKNTAGEKKLYILLGIAAAYALFEAFGIAVYNTAWASYRIAEVLLFITYIIMLNNNKSEYDELYEKTGKIKYQIPSFKISALIFIVIAALSFIAGAIIDAGENNKTVTTTKTTTTSTVSDTAEKAPENKAKGTVSKKSSVTVTDTEPKEEITDITLNQTASTEKYDFTLNKVEFSYKVEPDNPPSWYTYYDAPENEVYLYINASVKNNQKQSVRCDEVYSVTADYNNGYTYKGFNIADDTDGDFTYANITSIEPLQTLGVHCLIACPQEVETSESPLFLTITLKDGSKFKYTVR